MGRPKDRTTAIKDLNSFRRHPDACCFYRERWVVGDERTENGEISLYQVYCLQGMPPETAEDQERCFQRRTHCWRTGEALRSMGEPAAARKHSA